MKAFKKNSNVQWKWLGRIISGKVLEVYKESVTKTIKGKKITRHGSEEKPAYLVESEAGNEALKLHSELSTELNKAPKSKSKVSMFR